MSDPGATRGGDIIYEDNFEGGLKAVSHECITVGARLNAIFSIKEGGGGAKELHSAD